MHHTVFDTSQDLTQWLVKEVCKRLESAIEVRGHALLAVSGGSTPVQFFRALSKTDLNWDKILVTLVDERFVSPQSQRSNQRLVTIELLQSKAARAQFLPLYMEGEIDEAAKAARLRLEPYLPVDVMVLGMGNDGHTASLFPGADRLQEASDLENKRSVMAIEAPEAGEPRLTFTLAAIKSAKSLYLHIEGTEKREVLEKALQNGDPNRMPIRHVLKHCPNLRVVWAP